MSLDSLLAVLMFIMPGFVALECANWLSARRAFRQTEKDRLYMVMVMGSIGFALAARLHGTTFGDFWKGFLEPGKMSGIELVCVFASAIAVGVAWGMTREYAAPYARIAFNYVKKATEFKISQWTMRMREWLAKQFTRFHKWMFQDQEPWKVEFEGRHPVWQETLRHCTGPRYVQILMKNNLVYYGQVQHLPTEDDDRDLVLRQVSVARLNDGQTVPDADSYIDLDDDLVHVVGSEIVSMVIRRPPVNPEHADSPETDGDPTNSPSASEPRSEVASECCSTPGSCSPPDCEQSQ